MAYRNAVYVSMDADNDIQNYFLMKAWKQSDNSTFSFVDAHDINIIRDASEVSIKTGLQERFRNTKVFILLVGESTKHLYKYVRWEIEQAIKRDLPCIVVNLNGARARDDNKCPAIIHDELAIHISFNAKILEHALSHWPAMHMKFRNEGTSGAYHYNQSIYTNLGL